MKKKLFVAIIISAIIYILTILYGLIQFNPLSEILFSGIKLTVSTFILTFLLLLLIETLGEKSTKEKNKDHAEVKEQSVNKSNPNVTKKYQDASQMNNQNNDNTEEDFEAMKPPVVEYDGE